MARLRHGDRVTLHRKCKGLPMGATGTVIRVVGGISDVNGTALAFADYYRVRWDTNWVTGGERTRDHKISSLVPFEVQSTPVAAPSSPPLPQTTGVSKRLALLQFDDAEAGLSNILDFSDNLKDIASAARKLRSLQNAVKHVALYRGQELNLFLTIKGKDVHLVKEVDGALQQALSIPLPVFARLVESLKAEAL